VRWREGKWEKGEKGIEEQMRLPLPPKFPPLPALPYEPFSTAFLSISLPPLIGPHYFASFSTDLFLVRLSPTFCHLCTPPLSLSYLYTPFYLLLAIFT